MPEVDGDIAVTATPDTQDRKSPILKPMLVAVLLGLVALAVAVWSGSEDRGPDLTTHANFYVLHGETTGVSQDLTQLGFMQVPVEHPEIGRNGYQGFSTADLQWRRASENNWHTGTPECLEHGVDGQSVTLGVFHGFDAEQTDRSYSVLAWLVCGQ